MQGGSFKTLIHFWVPQIFDLYGYLVRKNTKYFRLSLEMKMEFCGFFQKLKLFIWKIPQNSIFAKSN